MEGKTKEEDDDKIEDLIKLSQLSEASILKTLQNRFNHENIYSYIGSILVALNPYKMLSIYGQDVVKKYEGQPIGELPPHLFAISGACYSRMCRDQQDQVVLISGESGAGKTESTKLIMQYLAATNRNGLNDITDQILEGNPLLESFGNAKTIRNDNSSRFGKYIELFFQRGVLKAARTSQYLLEKSRIVKQTTDERNYHVFYEMLSAMNDEEKKKYGLQSASKYFYLNQGSSCVIPGRNDAGNFQILVRSLEVLGFSKDEKDIINKILAAVLHLGNIYFMIDSDADGVQLGSEAEIKWISHLLKLSSNWLKTDLTSRVMEARAEKVYTPLSLEQAQDARDAIAKALYTCLFTWLVKRINEIVYRPAREKTTTMGLLDIFGFEEIEINSFEQLCINYANEMLHSFFNECVFQHEQLEYQKDRIEWKHIEFPDNLQVIQLISCKPHGILQILDDECNFPQASDKSFLDKCHYQYQHSPLYEKPKIPSMEFAVYHYAGKVMYNVKTFLEKNKDTLRSDVIELLCQSKDTIISHMFEEMKNKLFIRTLSKTTGRYMTKKPRANTVAAQFNESLLSLIDTMKRSNPYFIRCIKPNINKTPMLFDKEVVLDQLRYSGVLQLIEIRKKGYPVRIKFPIFIERYQCLLKDTIKEYQMPNEVCTKILATVCPANELEYQVGASKVFLREDFEHRLDRASENVKQEASLIIQKNVRAFLKRKRFQKVLKATDKIQSGIRAWKIRSQFRTAKHGIVKAQALYRSYRQQQIYKQKQVIIQKEKENRKRELLRKQAREKMEREQQEKAMTEAASIANLDIPGELASVLSKEQGWQPPHEDSQITAVAGQVMPINSNLMLPPDINAHAFSKYVGVFFKNNHNFGVTTKPIRDPFLQLQEIDKHNSVSIFKLILRFMGDTKMNDRKRKIISDYIIQKGLQNEHLRDEIYCQIANQTWLNQNLSQIDQGWLLMANCLSCIPPSPSANKYFLKYVSDVGFEDYKQICQHKALQCFQIKPHLSRTYPPCLLEWKAAQKKANMALKATFPDEEVVMGHVESWTTCESFAANLLNQRNMFDNHSGWTVVLEEQSNYYELMGYDYILDVISEIEIIPGFPVCKSYSLVSSDHSTGSGSQRVDTKQPHDPDRDRTMKLISRLPEPLPLNASIEANAQQSRKADMVFSASNPLNKRHVEKFIPDLSDGSALNNRYYSRKSQVKPNISNQVNGHSIHEDSMSDEVDRISYDRESRLNGRHIDELTDISDVRLNSRYVKMQSVRQGMQGSRLESSSDKSNSELSNFVDKVFDNALNDHRDSIGEARIKGGGKIFAQPQVPMAPMMHTIPTSLNPQTLLTPLTVNTQAITNPALTNPAAVQFAQMAAAQQQQQQQQALVQAYLNQMVRNQRLVNMSVPPGTDTTTVTRVTTSRQATPSVVQTHVRSSRKLQQQQPFVQAALQQQQQQQALFQATLQQQQINPIAQPYLVLVQPDSAVANTPLTLTTGQQTNNASLLQASQQLMAAPSQNHMIVTGSQQSLPKVPAPPVYSKPAPPPVQPKPVSSVKKTQNITFQAPAKAAVTVSSPPPPASPPVVITNGNSTNHEEIKKSPEPMHKKAIPAEILLTSTTEKYSINRSDSQNSSGITINSPSESTGTSSLSSPSDVDLGHQLKIPPPAPPSPPVSVQPGTIRNRARAVHVGKVIWPPPAEPQHKKEVHIRKLDISENLAQNISRSTKPKATWKPPAKTQEIEVQTTLKQPKTTRSGSKLIDRGSHLATLKILESKFGGGAPVVNAQTETKQSQVTEVKEVKSLQTETTSTLERRQVPAAPIPAPPPAAPPIEVFVDVEPVKTRPNIDYSAFEGILTKLYQTKKEQFLTYKDVSWKLRLRKEVFSPKEKLEYAAILDLVFCQVVRDVSNPGCIRITKEQRVKMRGLLESHHVYQGNHLQKGLSEQVKRIIVDTAKEWPTYFCRLFPVACGHKYPFVIYLGVNHCGVYLVMREKTLVDDQLKVVESFQFEDIVGVVSRSINILQLTMQNKGVVLYTKWAPQIKTMIDEYCYEHEQGSKFAYAKKDYQVREPTLLSFRQGDIIKLMDAGDRLDQGWLYGSLAGNVGFFPEENVRHMERHEVLTTFKPAPISMNGHGDNHSDVSMHSGEVSFVMLDYARKHFRQAVEQSRSNGLGQPQWTEKDEIEMVKWSQSPIQSSLLFLTSPELNTLAVESFTALMTFMTDLPMIPGNYNDVDCAMRILKTCHKYPELREEVYCQLCKQTTCNKSVKPKSLIRGWRYFTLFAAYNDCSEMLRPYLTKYLENAAMESSIISPLADTCLKNLRKTFRYGGRKNVPFAEEIASIAEGRMSKQHSFCYSGQARPSGIVQIKSSTLVMDIIADLCSNLDITDSVEVEEYTLFLLINTTKPNPKIHRLKRDEYILDITADLQKNNRAYEIMFQRTVWFFPVRQVENEVYIDLLFMQCINDYLEGFLLVLKNGMLSKESTKIADITVLGALLHQTSGNATMPLIKDLKNIIPKPVLESKDIKPQQWLNKIHEQLKITRYDPHESKARFIQRLSKWELFGSAFFKLKSIPTKVGECWLAVNKNGIQILGKVDHELLVKYEFNEILSTRLYRDNNKSFLDMKLGNLMAQRISRVETDQCSDISTLIGQYIHVNNRQKKKQGNAVRTPLFN